MNQGNLLHSSITLKLFFIIPNIWLLVSTSTTQQRITKSKTQPILEEVIHKEQKQWLTMMINKTYGVKSSLRKGEPSVKRVWTRVPNIKQPKTLKRILRVTTEECFLFCSMPTLCNKCFQNESNLKKKVNRQPRKDNLAGHMQSHSSTLSNILQHMKVAYTAITQFCGWSPLY